MFKLRQGIAIIVVVAMMCSFITVSAAGQLQEYSLLDGSVRLLGRGENFEDGYRTFNWPNTGIEFKFTGTRADVNVVVQDGVFANIQIDGGQPNRVLLSNGWNSLCNGLSDAEHTIRFVRSSEAHAGTFKMNKMRANGKPYATNPLKKRIEFIGDSYTTGYANVYTGKYNFETHYDTDNWYAYDAYVARMIDDYNVETKTYDEDFGAEFNVIAHQGKGLYVNGYDDIDPFGYTMDKEFLFSDVYLNKSGAHHNMSTEHKWNFMKYQPQLVVVWLGTNDFTGSHYATSAGVEDVPLAFENRYVEFIEKIRTVYPYATILCMAKTADSYEERVLSAVNRVGGENANVFFLSLTSFKGTSLWHPSKIEAEQIAKQVTEAIYEIDSKVGIWDAKTIPTDETISIRADYNSGDIFISGNTGKGIEQVGAVVLKPETDIESAQAKDVKHISQAMTDSLGNYDFVFNMDAVEGGYVFYMNSRSQDNVSGKNFEFTSFIPKITLKSREAKVDEISDITENDLDITIEGFDLEEGFSGVVIVSQYSGDKMVAVETLDASENTTVYGNEIQKNIFVNNAISNINIMYINTSTYAPIIGKYEIK